MKDYAMKSRLIYLLSFLYFFVSAHAQSGRLFTADVELSNSLINQVYQDRNGIIWTATEDGLNRYDGSKHTICKHEEGNPNSPLHDYVRSLFEDSRGNFYIGYLNGLQMYDYASGVYTEIPLILRNGNKFNAHVISMVERRNGQILIGTSGHGLFELTVEEDRIYAQQTEPTGLGVSIVALLEDRNENLWVSTDDKGLFRIGKGYNTKTFFTPGEVLKETISSICRDSTGNIFVGSINTGLHKLDPATDTFVSIPDPENPSLPIKSLYVSHNNDLLIGTDGYGMKRYKANDHKITDEPFGVNNFDSSKSKIHSIIEDENKNLWLGVFQKGVILLPARSGKFEYLGFKSVAGNVIGSSCIVSIYADKDGTLWVGTDSDGIYGVSKDKKHSKHFPHTRQPHSVPSIIMCMYEDSERNLWLGSYLHGLARFDRTTGRCEYIKGLLDQNQFPIQRVYSLTEDNDGNLWIATMGEGLFFMNLETRKITRFAEIDGSYINSWINCLLKTRNDRLYIATYDGLFCVDLKTNKAIPTGRGTHLLARATAYTLYEDHKGTLWIGTSQGLTSYDQETGRVATYTVNDGLPSNVICAIREEQGDLWISTNSGISRFNPEKRTFTNYFYNDGLQGDEFSKNATYADAGGQLFFGGLNGITFFHPQEITVPEKMLQIRLTDFYIHDKPIKKGMKSGRRQIIDTAVKDAETFRLAHNDNSFTIEFSAMEFINPERVTYLYSMNDNNYIRLRPGTNRVSFNKLAPGEYRFRVMAQDYDALSEVKEIGIVISPAWYLSFWAKCLYWLIALFILFLIVTQVRHRYKSHRRAIEHQHAQEINEAKLQFFINVSHEIRTPMSLVLSPLKKLMATDKDDERRKAYAMMDRHVNRVLNLINQLMDIRKIDKGQMMLKFREVEMVKFLKDICSMFDEQAETKHIKFNFRSRCAQLNAWVDARHFDKVIINVISNALKFTPENGEVDVCLQPAADDEATLRKSFEIIVSDNGIGINENEIERIFERFYQSVNTLPKYQEGTGVGLNLVRTLMKLHHGSIRAENNPDGKGCRFIIRLPLGCEHLKPEEMEVEVPQPAEPEKEEIKNRSKSKRNILIVDDDRDIREYLGRELSEEYHTIECENGKEALKRILKKVPDLVITDVVMPEMDGIALCKKIKQNININHIPVVLLTAKSKDEDNLEGLGTGADAYIVKPFNIEILKKTVQSIIRNREMLKNNFSGNQLQKSRINKIVMKSPDDKLMERIMKVINKNISNTELSVEMIAVEVGISRVHLHRKLKELTNQSTRDLIRNIRLQQAAALLSDKKHTVSEVATATGFTNLTHFSTAFKDVYGVSPAVYMETHLAATVIHHLPERD